MNLQAWLDENEKKIQSKRVNCVELEKGDLNGLLSLIDKGFDINQVDVDDGHNPLWNRLLQKGHFDTFLELKNKNLLDFSFTPQSILAGFIQTLRDYIHPSGLEILDFLIKVLHLDPLNNQNNRYLSAISVWFQNRWDLKMEAPTPYIVQTPEYIDYCEETLFRMAFYLDEPLKLSKIDLIVSNVEDFFIPKFQNYCDYLQGRLLTVKEERVLEQNLPISQNEKFKKLRKI